jgi:riboflavin kinase/FMN adenylyltransferase
MAEATVVGIGTFDGVHLGHQAILTEMGREAGQRCLGSVAYAFGVPPRLHAETDPGRSLLLPESVKLRLLCRSVDRVVRASFPAIRDLSPAQFAKRVLVETLNAQAVVVGPSFRFGARRAGDPEALRSLGTRLGFSVSVVPPVLVDGDPVNSTRIRALFAAGEIAKAAALLGRPPVLVGDVAAGDRVGRTLGYPTANLSVDPHVLLPAHGVYVARAFTDRAVGSAPQPGLLYVGTRPTLAAAGGDLRCEIHLLTPPEAELYDAPIEVHVLAHLRGDLAFASLEELRLQIQRDADRAAEVLVRFPQPTAPIAG